MLLFVCSVSVIATVVTNRYAYTFQHASTLTLAVRATFVPMIVAFAFLTDDPIHNIHAAVPAPIWLILAARVLLTVPLMAVTLGVQFAFAAAGFTIIQHRSGDDAFSHGSATMNLVWPSFVAEMAVWAALAIAVSAMVGRTRWNDLAGPIAACASVAAIGLLALTPWSLFPADPSPAPPTDRAAWVASDGKWGAFGIVALLIICWASRDPWHRLRLNDAHSRRRRQDRAET